MSKAKLQIDLKPVSKEAPKDIANCYTSYFVDLYFNGQSFRAICSYDTVMEMQNAGLVKQVKGQVEDENGDLIEFEYPDKIDGAGVQFTSSVFEKTN